MHLSRCPPYPPKIARKRHDSPLEIETPPVLITLAKQCYTQCNMPRREDYLEAFWVRKVKVDRDGPHYVNPPPTQRVAVVRVKTRTGMQYTREVKRGGWVTQREAAELLKVSVMTVNRWVRDRTLQSVKREGVSVLPVKAVAALADERKIEAQLQYPTLKQRRRRD
jgi:excisionase family DNA binding protein